MKVSKTHGLITGTDFWQVSLVVDGKRLTAFGPTLLSAILKLHGAY